MAVEMTIPVDEWVSRYVQAQAETERKPPVEILRVLVQEAYEREIERLHALYVRGDITLRGKVPHQIYLQGFPGLRLEEKLTKVLRPSCPTDTTPQVSGQLGNQHVGLSQRQIVQREQVQVHAQAMVQVVGSQSRAAGQEEELAGIGGEEAREESRLQGCEPLASHAASTCPGHRPTVLDPAAAESEGCRNVRGYPPASDSARCRPI